MTTPEAGAGLRAAVRMILATDDDPTVKEWRDLRRAYEAALAESPPALDAERLAAALAVAEVNCWADDLSGHKITDEDGGTAAHRRDAIAIAREYAATPPTDEEKA